MRPIDEKVYRQKVVMWEAERWLSESGSRLRLESGFPHLMAVWNRCVQG